MAIFGQIVASAIILAYNAVLAWDPDAGLVKSWTKLPGVSITTTSNQNTAYKVNDGDDNTHWMSGSCLPIGYLTQDGVNLLLKKGERDCLVNGNPANASSATDGSFYTSYAVPVSATNQKARFELDLGLSPRNVATRLSLWGQYNDLVEVKVETNNKVILLHNATSAENWGEIRMADLPTTPITKVILESTAKFVVKEISAIGSKSCIEAVAMDLGASRTIATVRTRHWAGSSSAIAVTLMVSIDGVNWIKGGDLDPSALHAVNTELTSPGMYRYIAVEYEMPMKDYAKIYCWEIDAFDENGRWGVAPVPKPHHMTLREMLGVNGIWGWGHSKYSDLLQQGQGPSLYNQMASHARNYHNLNWDVLDPDNDPEFEEMGQGHGTNAHGWLNWDREYNAWKTAGLKIDASIQFLSKSFPPSTWDDVTSAGFNYGKEFAKHFGPQVGNGLVQAMEIGNEPWDYSASFYASVLESMSAGARSVDGSILVMPCALQAYEIAPSEPNSGNYIGNRLLEPVAANISVLNTHAYSFTTNSSGVRIATYPENINSEFNGIRNMLRWRDVNMPSTAVWLTEWGWDADGKGENCRNTECVSEQAQAIYGVRALLIAARLGIEKVTWYFYANTNGCDTLFCRSGLTTSTNQNFAKKSVFHAMEALLGKIGNVKFQSVLLEDDSNGFVYSFGHSPNQLTHLVAWLPKDISVTSSTHHVTINLPCGYAFGRAWQFTGDFPALRDVQGHICPSYLELSVKPMIIELSRVEPPVVG